MPYQRITANIQGKYRRETLAGKPHLVVPCVMLKDDIVLNGSEGAILYPGEENEKSVEDWNGMPIVVYHPKKGEDFVSARSPEFYDAVQVGLIFNTNHEDSKLKPECWFDEARTQEVDERVYHAIINELPMDVSTGLRFQLEKVDGVQDGIQYKGKARNYKPDHLAVLPDKKGALPVEKGGGLYANEDSTPLFLSQIFSKSLEKHLSLLGLTVKGLTVNEMSYTAIAGQLAEKLAGQYGEKGRYWRGYIEEIFSDYVVFCNGDGKTYKVKYTASDKGVELVGDAVEVVRKVDYVAANEVVDPQPKENEMAFDKKAHVNALIANGQIEEKDRATFEAMDEKVLQAMKVLPKQEPTPTPAPAPVVNQAPIVVNGQTMTKEQLIALLPPDFMTVHNQGAKALARQRSQYVEVIKANPNNKFSDLALNEMDIDVLAATAELARGAIAANQNGQDPRFLDGWNPNAQFTGMGGYIPPVANNEKLEDPPEDVDVNAGFTSDRFKRDE
jgi:hypothetical protein